MSDGTLSAMKSVNEKPYDYAPGSAERELLEVELRNLLGAELDIPLIIGGKEIRTGKTQVLATPDDRSRTLGRYHKAGAKEAALAVEAALAAKQSWAAMPRGERAAIFRKAAALISGKYRPRIVAATMLGQGKTAYQAEIDAACETADFFRFNPVFAEQIWDMQPDSTATETNRMEYRPLEGFVYAVTPFNFTSIAANLPSAPALMGNTVVWKPASSSILSNWVLMKVYEEAGLPPGVINFLPGSGSEISAVALARREFAGLHFTGSTRVFKDLWRQIAANIDGYSAYPRIVGETGGKDFIFMDPSADQNIALAAAVRGAFEYQGQKCSAASRLYVPRSVSGDFLPRLADEVRSLPMGKVTDFGAFLSAVIDEAAFDTIEGFIERARRSPTARILAGGGCDKSEGFYIEPTLIEDRDPRGETMVSELFGPVLTVHVYDDGDRCAAYRLVDSTSPYGLTGSVIARDRNAIIAAQEALRNAAGNFYVNDKPTGAVVGRQPFGGMRGSGTNDKAGSFLNLTRWVNALAVKENLDPPSDWRYANA
ncbi:MAG: L-glutamate gamma-semialdehyde dehydrogenase [Rectinemataceae bacterium]